MNKQSGYGARTNGGYITRARRRLATEATRFLFRKTLEVKIPSPIVSFTFDDFPRSAFVEAGPILKRYGGAGTYYASFGLMGKKSDLGQMYQRDDLKELVGLGHELGCHTFGHCHSWNTPSDIYDRAIVENREALAEALPGASFQTFAYPHSAPRLAVKKVTAKYFRCCRGGGMRPGRYLHRHTAGSQTFNSGWTDLNYLCAFFLEKSRDNPQAVKSLIDQNARSNGWLIFATHDVCPNPSPFGCTPDFFEQVVEWSSASGARILPVVNALEMIQERLRIEKTLPEIAT